MASYSGSMDDFVTHLVEQNDLSFTAGDWSAEVSGDSYDNTTAWTKICSFFSSVGSSIGSFFSSGLGIGISSAVLVVIAILVIYFCFLK